MTLSRETLSRIDGAITSLEQSLEAVQQIPKQGEDGVRIDGIEHGLMSLAERLQSLRDDVAGDGDRTE